MNNVKKSLAAFIVSIVFTIICLIAEVFCVIVGIDTIDLVYNAVDTEGIALIVLFPLYLIISITILVLSQFAAIPSIVCLSKKYRVPLSIIFICLNEMLNIINVAMLVIILIK